MDRQPASDRQVDQAIVERLFMALHGDFGNPFLDKFRLGEQRDGKDIGIENAKRVWQAELARFTVGEVFGGLSKLRESAATFAPSLPEFLACCKACRRVPLAQLPALPAPHPGRFRERLIQQRRRFEMQPAGGLAAIFAVMSKAVANAGGDEVATLRRLEVEVLGARPDGRP